MGSLREWKKVTCKICWQTFAYISSTSVTYCLYGFNAVFLSIVWAFTPWLLTVVEKDRKQGDRGGMTCSRRPPGELNRGQLQQGLYPLYTLYMWYLLSLLSYAVFFYLGVLLVFSLLHCQHIELLGPKCTFPCIHVEACFRNTISEPWPLNQGLLSLNM